MNNRLEKLEKKKGPTGPNDELIALGEKWQSAVREGDIETAVKARKDAKPYFDDKPELKQQPPSMKNKTLYIDWGFFVGFLNERTQNEYITATNEGVAPGFSSLNYENKDSK